MSRLARLLKPPVVSACLAAVGATAPGLRLSVRAGGNALASFGDGAGAMDESDSGIVAEPLCIDGRPVGTVLVADEVSAARARVVAEGLATVLQKIAEAENARRAVSAEALDAYREMALMHRVAVDLNGSLNPVQVGRLLLQEFIGRSDTRSGAVFLFGDGADQPALVAWQPADSGARFGHFAASGIGKAALNGDVVGIVNEIGHHPAAGAGGAEFGCLLAVPLRAQDKVLGVVALLDEHEFPAADLKRAETVASIAAISLRNAQLFADQKQLFSALVDMIAHAIDAKSAYTSGHCKRVPVLARMLADRACAVQDGPLADFRLSEEELEALDIAAALHDCGKIVTPEWVMDKATKLQAIRDRMEEVALRFAVLHREVELAAARGQISAAAAVAERRALTEELAFLHACNTGGEFMSEERVARVREIAKRRWHDADGAAHPLLTEEEIENLSVPRGTLLPEERKIIEDHVRLTRQMLERLPFKGALRAVPEIAGGHHERLDGTGYPQGLSEEQLSVQARILAIADVFEALTAPDRPYRRGATVSRAVDIMRQMVEAGHLDAHLFRLMIENNIHVEYARAYVAPEQIDLG